MNHLVKTGSYVSAATAIVAAVWFLFIHFADANETSELAKSTEQIVAELQEIKVKQASAEEQMKNLCAAGLITDKMECAKVGEKVEE